MYFTLSPIKKDADDKTTENEADSDENEAMDRKQNEILEDDSENGNNVPDDMEEWYKNSMDDREFNELEQEQVNPFVIIV